MVTLREYVDVARDRWRVVLAGLLLGLLVAGAVTVLIPREYSADVTMIVSATAASTDPSAASDGESLSAQRVRTYVELMRSKRLAGDVIEALDLPLTPDELASRITATSAPETVLLTATVTGSTPQGAIDLANVVATQFIKNVAELEQPDEPGAGARGGGQGLRAGRSAGGDHRAAPDAVPDPGRGARAAGRLRRGAAAQRAGHHGPASRPSSRTRSTRRCSA